MPLPYSAPLCESTVADKVMRNHTRALKNTWTAKASSEGAAHRIHHLFLDAEQETLLGSAWLTSSPLDLPESDGPSESSSWAPRKKVSRLSSRKSRQCDPRRLGSEAPSNLGQDRLGH